MFFRVKNTFFGGGVTVSGLVTAGDIIRTLENEPKFDELIIPYCMLRDGEDIFLDNITLDELEDRLGMPVTPTPNDGYIFIENILKTELSF